VSITPDKERYTYIYHPSREHKERWQKLARKSRTPLSKFVIGIVDSVIDADEEFAPRGEMQRELDNIQNENKGLREDIQRKTIVLERYESELKRYRSQTFLDDNYGGVRRYSKELIEILKSRLQMDGYKLLEVLGVDPKDSETVKGISKQLEELEEYGLVRPVGKGWRWIG